MAFRRLAFGLALALAVTSVLSEAGQAPAEKTQGDRLAAVLKRSAEYCQRLGGAALDFVCMEEVREETARLTPETKTFLYDYQFIRKNEEAKEKRTLVAIDGEKVKPREAELQAISFRYENVLFG